VDDAITMPSVPTPELIEALLRLGGHYSRLARLTVNGNVYGVVTHAPSQDAQSVFGVGRPERADLQPVQLLAARR
jgi:hypothetical protein